MLRIKPISRALVPANSDAAEQVADRNYDEFQSDLEIWSRLQSHPNSILGVTMSHCQSASPDDMIIDGSDEALRSTVNMTALIESALTRTVSDCYWVYEILDPNRPGVRQIGLGCMAETQQIRTGNPEGTIIRNEGIREKKAAGRAKLIDATQSYIGVVNNTFVDENHRVATALEAIADAHTPDFEATDEKGYTHRSWLVTDEETIAKLTALFAEVPCAYVADGNHRSAAAAHLKRTHFLNVLFPSDRMGLAPYNRLVRSSAMAEGRTVAEILDSLAQDFEITQSKEEPAVSHHRIGVYFRADGWYVLTPKKHTFDPSNAVEVIDADIIRRCFFERCLGIQTHGTSSSTLWVVIVRCLILFSRWMMVSSTLRCPWPRCP